MNQIFEKQTLRRIVVRVVTTVDLSTATDTQILFVKPNGKKGVWPATLTDNDFSFNATSGEVNMPGLWKFSATGKIGGLSFYSEIVEQFFDKPID